MRHAQPLPVWLQRQHPLVSAFLRRPVTLAVLVSATVVVGLLVAGKIKLELMPAGLETRNLNIEIPLRSEQSQWSPEEIERRITLPVEGELATVPGIEALTASSSRTGAEFDISFRGGTDLDDAYAQVRDRIERVRARLGDLIGHVQYRRWNMSGMALAFLNITWDDSVENPFDKLRRHVLPALEATPGVARANAWGQVNPYFRVALIRERLAAHPDVDTHKLMAALRGENLTASAGMIDAWGKEAFVVVDARFAGIDDLRAFPVAAGVTLGDIADIRETASADSYVVAYQREARSGQYRGGRGVWAMINQASDANVVDTGRALDRTVEELAHNPLLAGFTVQTSWNQGSEIVEQIGNLMQTLLVGGLLAIAALLLFVKRLRLALIIALSIPLSMTMALVVMYFAGETLNLFALMGFTVAAGMLVDNAIVVSENIFRRAPLDGDPDIAAARGAGEVGLALILATSTTVVVFLAVIFFNESEMARFFMARIGYPICLSLAASVLTAMALIPWSMNRVLSLNERRPGALRETYHRFQRGLAKGGPVSRVIAPGIALFLGRAPGVAASSNIGDGIEKLRRRMPLYTIALLVGLAGGAAVAWQVFGWLGGDDFMGPLRQPFEESENARASGSMRWMEQPSPHAALTAIGAGLVAGFLPLLMLVLSPRRADAREGAPLISRMARVYGAIVGWLLPRKLTMALYLAVLTAALLFLGGKYLRSTESNPGTQRTIEMRIGLPPGFSVQTVSAANEMARPREIPREWTYFLTLRKLFFGIGFDGTGDPAAQQEAWRRFGLERGALSLTERNIRLWLTIAPERTSDADAIERDVRAALPREPGIRMQGGFERGFGSRVAVHLRGKEFGMLREIAEQLEGLAAAMPGVEVIASGQEEIAIGEAALLLDRTRAMALGVEAGTLAEIVAFHLNGMRMRDVIGHETVRPVQVVMDAPRDLSGELRKPAVEDVMQFGVPAGQGRATVGAVSRLSESGDSSAGAITRRDRQTTLSLTFQTAGSTYELAGALRARVESLSLPAGYEADVESASPGGSRRGGRGRGSRVFGEDDAFDMASIMAAMLLVGLVMGFLFESFMLPVVVLLACVPGAIAGAQWSLLLTDTMMDQICGLGMIILVGVSVNNGIVMVDLMNRLRREGMPMARAVRLGAEQRFRPMLMTTFTTVVGVLPMAIGSTEVIGRPYYPLGRTILGGMALSMLLTLVMLPLLYALASSARDYMRELARLAFGRRKP